MANLNRWNHIPRRALLVFGVANQFPWQFVCFHAEQNCNRISITQKLLPLDCFPENVVFRLGGEIKQGYPTELLACIRFSPAIDSSIVRFDKPVRPNSAVLFRARSVPQ